MNEDHHRNDLSPDAVASIARRRFGDPNAKLSTRTALRFGRKGSVKVNLETGAFIDYQTGLGGYLRPDDAPVDQRSSPVRIQTPPKASQRWSALAQSIWDRGAPTPGSPVEAYQRARGCWLPEAQELRFLNEWLGWPAQMARITDVINGEPLSLHFTLLARDGSGKAPVEKVKLLLAGHAKAGGCVRLVADDAVAQGLGLAEGIETALSVLARGWSPVWVTIDAGNMAKFPVLPGVDALTIFADHDEAGTKAARACAARWIAAERQAVVVTPCDGGADFNDVITRGPA